MTIPKNITEKEALIRYVVAVILLGFGHFLIEEVSKPYGIAINLIAFVLLSSGYFRFCILYKFLKRR